ncbi:MAG: SCO family protein [Acidobacteria bacterium]|nr:SCO family protein [Acidobacteriota bacterium]MDA1236191.1 SCO family protein [Acidobacteriota bacterium]
MRPAVFIASLLLCLNACQRREPLPNFASVPPFALTAQDGRYVTDEDYQGRVWIADFVFTNCPGPCPMLTSHMRDVQDLLVERSLDVPLVSFSVDPETDTPEVLTEYGKTFGADFTRWAFLTGEKQKIYDLILHGFLLAVSDGAVSSEYSAGPGIITHSTRFALVDQNGEVRGYYHGEEPTVAAEIVADAERLLAKSR